MYTGQSCNFICTSKVFDPTPYLENTEESIRKKEEEDRLRLEEIYKKYPLLAEPTISYFGAKPHKADQRCLYDKLYLDPIILDKKAKRSDRKRHEPQWEEIYNEERRRLIPVKTQSMYGFYNTHFARDHFPYVDAQKDFYRRNKADNNDKFPPPSKNICLT